MKRKTVKKLAFNKQTMHNLSSEALNAIRGGEIFTISGYGVCLCNATVLCSGNTCKLSCRGGCDIYTGVPMGDCDINM